MSEQKSLSSIIKNLEVIKKNFPTFKKVYRQKFRYYEYIDIMKLKEMQLIIQTRDE